MEDHHLALAAATRPYPGETANGDAWVVHRNLAGCRLAVIDGLGHGPAAAEASAIAITALASHLDLEPAAALARCHQALTGSRGAAMAIASIDVLNARLTYAGVGNVEAWLWQDGRVQRPISYRGIVGLALPSVRSFEFPLGPDWLLLVYTDGISLKLAPAELMSLAAAGLQPLADTILERRGRARDDATVVAVRPRRDRGR